MNRATNRAFLVLTLLSLLKHIFGNSHGRPGRLVLHSDEDVAGEVLRLKDELAALKADVNQMKATGSMSSSGSTYTRWGRTSCPGNGTELVYKGYMAGAQWNIPGSGSNHLCLPDDPTWGQYVESSGTGSLIEGTEIDLADNIARALFGKPVYNQDIPCAVCTSSRNAQAMVPGRFNCYPGWQLEYAGYLASPGNGWSSNSEYVCLDAGLEFLPHGGSNDDQHDVTLVEAHCGSLACPPYHEGREIACVVCTK